MTATELAGLKTRALEYSLNYCDGLVYSLINGNNKYTQYLNDAKSVDYLYQLIGSTYLVGSTPTIGSDGVTDDYIYDTIQKLGVYGELFDIDFTTIPVGDEEEGETPVVPITDVIRSGVVPVLAGVNNISFSRALSSTAYDVDCYVIYNDQSRDDSVPRSNFLTTGFVVSDVLKAGTLHYTAILNI